MLTKNYNDKQVAALCLTNIIASFDVLQELDCVQKTEYQGALISIMNDTIARLTGAITSTEEAGVSSELLTHANALISACNSCTTEEVALQKLAKENVLKFRLAAWQTETKAQGKAEKGEN